MIDVLVIGAGPAGVMAALRAADLGARTTLVSSAEFGGMAANDGPVPVRALAHASRLLRDARQLGQYGVTINEPSLDYSRLLARVQEIVRDVRTNSSLRMQIDALGVTVCEQVGAARFIEPHVIETRAGLRLRAEKVIICTGGASRRLPIPGFELTSTHTDAWALTSVPRSMLVVGAGATGVQVASIFNAFGSRIELFEAGPRILATEDVDISTSAAVALRRSGIAVHENFGAIDAFEKTATGVRMRFTKNGQRFEAEAELVVVATGWAADTESLNLAVAGVELNQRKFVKVDEYLRTSIPHIFAAGDVTGHLMLVPQAIQAGFVAASNAVRGPRMPLIDQVSPMGSFTEPEYAQAGLTESKAREAYDIVTSIVHFEATTRTIIDGRKFGFCKLVVDRKACKVLGCHVIGERAVDIAEVAAIAIAAGMRVDDLAQIPLAYPTYAGILVRAAVMAAGQLGLTVGWQAHQVESGTVVKNGQS
ncbi:NAD(P)/FAD-dependent oxidoreductase [Bradyrhizobium sp. AS23.2]|uniref:dihydrolipoyl dehydrogenase family protein n=1 Tax=Bradyrhizobium sp. AS23.2 TaxID=1680155 RepID=UPI00143027D2|nr:NAD(P)/FAD-dependent oxidoreductase [Bradyrhizobium sp. AS23.2]